MSFDLKYDLRKYKILSMERKDMDAMYKLWKDDEGCENSPCTADSYFNIDPQGYFKGVIGDEIVSTILALRYSSDFAFIGYFIVNKHLRNKHLGTKLFNIALEYCEDRTIELISVENQIERYKKIGFSAYGVISTFQGKVSHSKVDFNIQKYDENAHLDDIVSYDQDCFPANRKEFLKSWLKKDDTKTFVFYDKNNKLSGYGSIYKNVTEYVISPCYCDSKEIAKAVIGSLINSVDENAKLVIFIHKEVKCPVDFINQTRELYNWKKSEDGTIMYKNGNPPKINLNKCFSIVCEGIG